MKVIRIATLAFALCAGMTSVAAAQGQPEPKEGQGEMRRGGGMGGMLLKDITLTEAQKEQVKTIREKYVPRQLELRQDDGASEPTVSGDPRDPYRRSAEDLRPQSARDERADGRSQERQQLESRYDCGSRAARV